MDTSHVSGASSSTTSSTTSSGKRTASWLLSFDNLLNDSEGLAAFVEFSEKEHSDENIHFWMDCQKLRSLNDSRDIKKQVRHMYASYFAHTALQLINVDDKARKAADDSLLTPTNQSFKDAEVQVYSLMRDDIYGRFLKSDLFASHVKDDISEAGQSSSSRTLLSTPSHKPLTASSSLKQEGKDSHRIVSWYKTSLRPKLLRSSKKRPKSLNFDAIPPPAEDTPETITSSPAISRSTKTTASILSQTSSSSSGSHPESRPELESTTSLKKIDMIPEENPIPSTSSCPASSSHERHHKVIHSPHHQKHRHHQHDCLTPPKKSGGSSSKSKGRDSLDRFLVSPISFNLNSDKDYEEFFADLVSSCSDRRAPLDSSSLPIKDVTHLKFTSIFHSQPCLPDVISQSTSSCQEIDDKKRETEMRAKSDEDDLLTLKTSMCLSPSLHDIYDQIHPPRHRHHHSRLHHYHFPPPPLPPKGSKHPVPLPPPVKASSVQRNLSSYEALYV